MAHGWNNTKLSLNEGFGNLLASPDENLTLQIERPTQEKDLSDNFANQAVISSYSDTCTTTNSLQHPKCPDSEGKGEGISLSLDPQLEIGRGHLEGKSCSVSDITVDELNCLIPHNQVFGGCVNAQDKTDLLDQYSDVSSCSELDSGALAEFDPENNCYEPERTQIRCNFNPFKTSSSSTVAGSLERTSESENIGGGNDLSDMSVTASDLSSYIHGPHKDKEQGNHALMHPDGGPPIFETLPEIIYDASLREAKKSQNLECTLPSYPDCHVSKCNSLLVSTKDSGSVDGAEMRNMIVTEVGTTHCETHATNQVLESCFDVSETLSSKSCPQELLGTDSVNVSKADGKKLKEDDVLGVIKGGEGPGSSFEFLERCLGLSSHAAGAEQKNSPAKESLNGITKNISDTATGAKTVLTIQDSAPLPLVQMDFGQVAADQNTEQTLSFFSQSGEDSLHAQTSDDPSASVFEKVKFIGTTAVSFSCDSFNKQLTKESEQIREQDLAHLISHDLKQLLHPVVLLKCSRQNVTEKNRYHCSKCQEPASSLSQLIKHHHITHSPCSFHFCQMCGCYFTNEKLAKKHSCNRQLVKPAKKAKKQSCRKSYNCQYCNLTFNKLYEYHKHERIHTGITPFKCEKCGFYFSQAASLSRHKRLGRCRVPVSQDSPEKSNGQMSQHALKAQELSSSSMSVQLPRCFVKLVDFRKEKLKYEKSEKHKAFDKGFQLGAVVSHRSSDSDGRRFKCHNCKKAFRHSSNLCRHKKRCRIGSARHQTTFIRHLKNCVGQYKCPLCPRVFKYSYNRFRHMRVQCLKDFSQQSKGKRASVYKCALCTRTFANSSNRNRHIRMVCIKEFIRRENLKLKRDFQDQRESLQHQLPAQPQQSDGLHKCDLCPAVFAHSSGKYKHMIKHKLFEKTGKPFRYRNSVPVSLNPEIEDSLRFEDKSDGTGNFDFSCHYCGKNFNSSSTLKKHTKLHKGERPYRCLECSKRFLRNSHLIAHKKVHQRRIQCTVCKKIVPTISELIKHRKTHINKGMLQCPDCPLQFKYPAFLLRHLSKHNSMQQNPLKEDNCSLQQKELQQEDNCEEFKCCLCQEIFDSAKTLNQHCLSHMPAHSTKQCPFCKRHFSNRPGLVRHIRLHTGEKPYRCHGCGKCFSRNEPLKTHQEKCTGEINKQHITPTPETEKKYSCKYCPQTFVWPCSLSKHQKNHILKVLFPCSKCGKCYKKLRLMSHEKICDPSAPKYTDTSTTTLLTCAKCGQTFYRKSNQVVHERKCTGARFVLPGNVVLKNSKCLSSKSMDKLKYRCLHCPKAFRYRCYLLRHLVVHARDKQYSCMHCGHRYASHSRYLQHEAFCDGVYRYRGSINMTDVKREQPSLETISKEKTIHVTKAEGEGEYKCKFCNKTFMRARNLRRHILTHTGVKPYRCKTCESCFSRYDHLKVHQNHCKGKKRKLEVRIVKISLEDLEEGWKKIVEKPQEMQMFDCNSCSKRFTTRTNLARHVAMLHTTVKPFSCNHCSTSFSHLSSLKKHDLKCKEKIFSVFSKASPEESISSNSMQDANITQPCHETSEIIMKIQRQYPDNRKFFCTYCPRRFKNQDQLKVHTRLHTGEKPFGCASCGERFIRRDYLQRHLIKCSFGPERMERLLCDMCGELFSSQDQLRNHLKNCVVSPKSPESHPTACSTTSSKIKGFSCTNCSQRFLLFSQLQQHFLTMHREDTSHQLLNSASSLKQQMSSSANVKEEPADEGYREDQLNSCALFANKLPIHKLGSNKKPCICPHCNVQFRNAGGLGMHLRIHSGQFSFSCLRCKRGFWSKNSLRKHHRMCRNLQVVAKEEPHTETTVPFLVSSKGTNTVLVFNSGSKATGTGVLQTEFSCKEGSKDSQPDSSDVQEKQKTFSKKDGTAHKYQCPECGQSFTDGLLLISHLEEHNRQKQEEKQGHCCRVCDKVFSHPAVLHRHLKMQHKKMPYACPECPKSFRYPSDLDVHRYCHDPNRPFICSACGLRFWSNGSLKRHSSAVHQKPLRSVGIYTCRKCDKTFPDRRSYQKHWKRKHYKAGMGCEHEPKQRLFSSKEVNIEVNIGETEMHSDDGDDSDDSDSAPYFPCHVCGKSFTTSESLEDHQRCHLGEKPHECGECGRCFFQLAHLQQHQRSHKSEFQCQTCGRGFVSVFALRKHKHSHGKSRPYRCPRCQLSFTGPTQLAEHMATHRDDNFPCDLCDRTFSCRLSRAQHRMTHTEPEESLPPLLPPADTANSLSSSTLIPFDADQLKYRCGICNKRFRDTEQLSEHGCYAGRERPYSCTECNQHFLQGSHLKKHQLSHPLSKAYSHQCHLCHMSFSYRHQYLNHLKGHGVQESEDSPSKKSTASYSLSNSENLYQSPVGLHSFPCPVELANHLSVHAEKIFACETCGETFTSESNLMEHEQCHLTTSTQYECTECGNSFLGSNAFRQHFCARQKRTIANTDHLMPSSPLQMTKGLTAPTVTLTHPIEEEEVEVDVGEDFYNCPVCDKRFPSKLGLEQHQQQHVTDHRFKCLVCGKFFAKKRYLKKHELIHQRVYQCKICPQTFDSAKGCVVHQDQHNETRRYQCPVCLKNFVTLHDLSHHKKTHSERLDEIGGDFHCDMCCKSFSQLSLLRQHQETHVGQVVYECTECDKAFAFFHLLEQHQSTHSVITPSSVSSPGSDLSVSFTD